MRIDIRVDNKVKEYVRKPKNLSSNLNNDHSFILNYVSGKKDWKESFNMLFKDLIDIKLYDKYLKLCKDISMVEIRPINGIIKFDDDNRLTPEVIEYLAKYIVKRRATYLYIWTLLMKKDFVMKNLDIALKGKLTNLQQMLADSPQTFATAAQSQTFNQNEILSDMRTAVQNSSMSEKNKQSAYLMLDRYSSGKSPFSINQVLLEFSNTISDYNKELVDYKTIVHDVLPLLVNWSDQ